MDTFPIYWAVHAPVVLAVWYVVKNPVWTADVISFEICEFIIVSLVWEYNVVLITVEFLMLLLSQPVISGLKPKAALPNEKRGLVLCW